MGKGAAVTTVTAILLTLAIQIGMAFAPWWYHKQYYFAVINPVTIDSSLFHLRIDAKQTCAKIDTERVPGLQTLKNWCDKWNGEHFIMDTRDIACSFQNPATLAMPGMTGVWHMCAATHGMLKAGWTIVTGLCLNVSMQLASLTLQAIYWNRGKKKQWFNPLYHNAAYRCTAAGSVSFAVALGIYAFFMRDMANLFGQDWALAWVVNTSQYPGFHIAWAISVVATFLQFTPIVVLACSKPPHEKQFNQESDDEESDEDEEEPSEKQPFLPNGMQQQFYGMQQQPVPQQQQGMWNPMAMGGAPQQPQAIAGPPGMAGPAAGAQQGFGGAAAHRPAGAPPGMAPPGMQAPGQQQQGFGAANLVK